MDDWNLCLQRLRGGACALKVPVRGARHQAVDLARTLLGHFGGLNRLFAASAAEFAEIPGMGSAKYAQLQAVLELARRALREEIAAGDALSSPRAMRDWLRLTRALPPAAGL